MKKGPLIFFYPLLLLLFCSRQTGAQQGFHPFPLRPDSATAAASARYQPQSFLRNFFMGRNYRKVWSQPVRLPVFHLSASGFTVKELGGGKQTKSLHLVDSFGKEWALRSADKEVEGAMPGWAKGTAAQGFMQDLISASFPYGAPVAGELSVAGGVNCAKPQAFFVADDTAFGKFRNLFANTVCLLEERDPGFDHTISSKELLVKLRKNTTGFIDQPSLLKARLLDMLFADWDRHEDNWRWGEKDSASTTYYVAIPRDRDWAFYESGGLLPKLLQWTSLHFLTGFTASALNFKKLNYKARVFDETFLNGLDEKAWSTAANELVEALTDSAINAAVHKMPEEIFRSNGKQFIQTLQARRNGLIKNAMKYYRFLSNEVIINGSDKNEHFMISSNGNKLNVTVYADSLHKQKIYDRNFSAPDTHLITINGFGGHDVVDVSDGTKSKIRFRIYSSGQASYNLKGRLKIKVDNAGADNSINKDNRK